MTPPWKMPAIAAAVGWSELPEPLLKSISARLKYSFSSTATVDYICFRSVCTSWRAAAPSLLHPPWVVGTADSKTYNVYVFDGCFSVIRKFKEPVDFGGATCFGSCHGWLALFDPGSRRISLWNPVTESQVSLPPIADFPDKIALSSSDPATSSGCTVVLSHGGWKKLSFCRPEDDAWTLIGKAVRLGRLANVDIAFYKGQFYFVISRRIYVCNFGPPAKLERIRPSELPIDYLDGYDATTDESYLVEFMGELLLVNISEIRYSARVFQLVWARKSVKKLMALFGLSDGAILVGSNNSICLSTDKYPGFEKNCVYRAYDKEEHVRVINLSDEGTGFDVSEDGLVKNLSTLSLDWAPCAWLTSSLMPNDFSGSDRDPSDIWFVPSVSKEDLAFFVGGWSNSFCVSSKEVLELQKRLYIGNLLKLMKSFGDSLPESI